MQSKYPKLAAFWTEVTGWDRSNIMLTTKSITVPHLNSHGSARHSSRHPRYVCVTIRHMSYGWLPGTERIYYWRWRQQYNDFTFNRFFLCLPTTFPSQGLYMNLWPRLRTTVLPVKLTEEISFIFQQPEDCRTAVTSAEPGKKEMSRLLLLLLICPPQVWPREWESSEEVWGAAAVLPGVERGDVGPHHQLVPGVPAPGLPGPPEHHAVHLAAHSNVNNSPWVTVEHSHWSRSNQRLCSDWLGSWCCDGSSLMP